MVALLGETCQRNRDLSSFRFSLPCLNNYIDLEYNKLINVIIEESTS